MPHVRTLQPGDEAALLRFLQSRPDTTMFLQGNLAAAGLVDRGRRCQGTYAAAFEGDDVVAVAGLFWNGNLIMEAPIHLEAVVREAVRRAPRPLQGLIGVNAYVAQARALFDREGAPASLDSRELLYRLELDQLVVPPALNEGDVTCRRAELDDLPVLVPWGCAYQIESIGAEDAPGLRDRVADSQRTRIAERAIWILHRGDEPVAMSAFNAFTADCVQIGGVYTPPELRSRGYARCAVAGSLLHARADGKARSILFTGEDNPAAQACYVRLGYKHVGDYRIVMFREPHELGL